MKERPIIFSGPMVRAILDGRKTQTRRVVKSQPDVQGWQETPPKRDSFGTFSYPAGAGGRWKCPHGKPGDRLWVRETWRAELTWESVRPSGIPHEAAIFFQADDSQRNNGLGAKFPGRPRPSIHMPRWASRILLEITDVRLERLQNITEADAVAEGAEPEEFICCNSNKPARHSARSMFVRIWSDIHGNDSVLSGPAAWDANPFVWVIEFRVIAP